ncbi:hypothetical protein WMY93_010103 [Mugilogobius chulae]|uniref:ADAM metallopeptidase domain 12 n=1 Tax=Mugilogobius chulae TaxID=88201 RepID=A0AAW0PGV3_9GOBI
MDKLDSSKQKHYGTTIPLQLVGNKWKPVHELRPKNHPSSLKLQIEVEGEQLLLALDKNHGLFASNYTETHYLEDGSTVTGSHNFTVNCYYHGEVEGHEDSDVTLSTCDGLKLVSFAERSFVLEPSSDHTDGTHWVYSARHLQLSSGTCGHESFNHSSAVSTSYTSFSSTLTDLDQEESNVFRAFSTRFQKQGKDVERVKQRLAEIANYVDKFYRALNIRVALVGLEVWSDVDKCPITQDPFTTLHEFLDWRKVKLLPLKPHDNAQLIRYPFPTVFSSCSKKDLSASLEKGVGMCLFNMPEIKVLYGGQKCGNGYVEEGEECDCGEPEECLNPCCNATTCTLKGDAVCAHDSAATTLKRAGTPCRESSNSCDLPEFCTGTSPHCPANVYLHDGHACLSVDGYCYNGICQTHEQQCITLWGQGAKAAPGICFERVNSAGDPYGNCGKDNKGLFAKCEPRDAKCGKIQCQGGANRPVIGTNAVSIETNIPQQEGGRILCRGTHVYLGDDMPDPGLVLTGTKCANGMMCLNRQCQNVSVFGVHQCASKCSGRGVCNNNKNCHCEAHWAPPFCDKAGFGGSVDSGPIRLADHSSVMAGVLVALLFVLGAVLVFCLKKKSLLGLMFTNNKGPLEKLRSVSSGLSGPSTPNPPPSAVSSVSPSRPAPPQPQTAAIFKPESLASPAPAPFSSHSLRRLPQCPPAHLSRPPVPLSLTLSLSPAPVQPRPPPPSTQSSAPSPPRPAQRRGVVRGASRHSSCRMVMELEKPSPPQKPLPADPRGPRLIRSPSVNQSVSVPGLAAVFGGKTEALRPVRPTPHTNRQGCCGFYSWMLRICADRPWCQFFSLAKRGPFTSDSNRSLEETDISISLFLKISGYLLDPQEPAVSLPQYLRMPAVLPPQCPQQPNVFPPCNFGHRLCFHPASSELVTGPPRSPPSPHWVVSCRLFLDASGSSRSVVKLLISSPSAAEPVSALTGLEKCRCLVLGHFW